MIHNMYYILNENTLKFKSLNKRCFQRKISSSLKNDYCDLFILKLSKLIA